MTVRGGKKQLVINMLMIEKEERERAIEMGKGNDVISGAEESLSAHASISERDFEIMAPVRWKNERHRALATLVRHTTNTLLARDHFTNRIHHVYPESPALVLLNFATVISHCLCLAGTHSDRKALKQKGKSHKDLYC